MPEKNKKPASKKYSTKKCPECYTYLAADAKKCTSCGIRVGAADKSGMAKRPFNYKAYAISLVAWIALCVYVWWAFLKE